MADNSTNTAISRFAITDGIPRSGPLSRTDGFSTNVAETHPLFPLTGIYTPHWESTSIVEISNSKNNTPFKFTYITVNRNGIIILENAENP